MSTTLKTKLDSNSLGVHESLRPLLEFNAVTNDANETTLAAVKAIQDAGYNSGASGVKMTEVTISAADIVATGAGKLGHSAGYSLVAAPGATKYLEFISAVVLYDYSVAAYTAGGNTTVNATGGSAITGLLANSALIGASADVVARFSPLTTVGVVIAINTGFSLVAASAFTQPGTAAGTVKVRTYYREHTL